MIDSWQFIPQNRNRVKNKFFLMTSISDYLHSLKTKKWIKLNAKIVVLYIK